jgi:hypothetical protein
MWSLKVALITGLVASAILVAPRLAKAEPASAAAASDEELVETTSGATYRGVLVERVPDDHLTLRLATGEIKRFAWSEIKTARTVQATAPRPPPAPAPLPPPAAPAARVRLVVDAAGGSLERRAGSTTIEVGSTSGTSEVWEMVCLAPCNEAVPIRGEFRVNARGMIPTDPFVLADARDVTVRGSMGSTWVRTGGKAILPLFGAAAVVGSLLFFASLGNSGSSYRLVGAGVGGVGLVGVLTGVLMWALSGSTARVEPQASAAATVHP